MGGRLYVLAVFDVLFADAAAAGALVRVWKKEEAIWIRAAKHPLSHVLFHFLS